MSGTEDKNYAVQNSETSQVDESVQSEVSPGARQDGEDEKLTASQKMNQLIRASSSKTVHKEVDRLRKEAAKYRVSSKEESKQRIELEEKAAAIQAELEALKEAHRSLKVMRALDKAGCIKSDLVAKDIPADCKNLETFIEGYKKENTFLFNAQKTSYGSTYKPSMTTPLTPSQKMDQSIRKALGR